MRERRCVRKKVSVCLSCVECDGCCRVWGAGAQDGVARTEGIQLSKVSWEQVPTEEGGPRSEALAPNFRIRRGGGGDPPIRLRRKVP